MHDKLPYFFNSGIVLDSSEKIRRAMQEMWEQLARVINQDIEIPPFDPNTVQQAASIGGGTEIQVNDVAVPTLGNFNDLTPQAPLEGHSNVLWQLDPDREHISAYVPDREDISFFGSSIFGISGAGQQTVLDFNPFAFGSNTAEYALPIGGWFRNPHASLAATNGPSTGMVYVKLDGGIIHIMKVSFPPNMAVGVSSNVRSSLRVEKGETFRFSFNVLGSTNINGELGAFGIEFASDDGSVVIGWAASGATTTVAASSTEYLHPLTRYKSTLLRDCELVVPFACTLRNFLIWKNATQPVSGSHVITIIKNRVATAVTITIPLSGELGIWSDFVNTVAVAAGDRIAIRSVNNATATARIHEACCTLLPSASAKTGILAGHFGLAAIASGVTAHCGPFEIGRAHV